MQDRTVAQRLAAVDARVVSNSVPGRDHAAIEMVLPAFPDSEPGQFLQLRCTDPGADAAHTASWPDDGFPSLVGRDWHQGPAFLRRPFSIADRWNDIQGRVHLVVISRTVGTGTRWLEHLRSGDILNLTGPLGRGFRIPQEPVSIALVGGGIGIPPLLYLARRLHESGRRDVTAVLGATTGELLPVRLREEPAADGTPRACVSLPGGAPFPAIVTTDDGTVGLRGLATDGLKLWHDRHAAGESGAVVYACGPEPMLRAAAHLTRQLGLECQLCIERNMGCGLGTCLSCVVPVCDEAHPDGWRWALTCTDGPVFDRDQLLDYSTSARP